MLDTVDSVIKSFQATITKLDKIATKQSQKQEKNADEIFKLEQSSRSAKAEFDRAVRISSKLREIIE